jgi:hypothetical protein
MRILSPRAFKHVRLTGLSRHPVYVSPNPHPRAKELARKLGVGAAEVAKMEQGPGYQSWSHERLIERVAQLEQELKNKNERSIHSVSVVGRLLTWKQPRSNHNKGENTG